MLNEIWEPNLTVLFVGSVVDELCDILGFYFVQPRNRFWEQLELSGITPARIVSKQESKALSDGHRDGSLSDPIRLVYIEKKTSQLRKLGVGITSLNRRIVAKDEKDQAGFPTDKDVLSFIKSAGKLKPRIIGFVMSADIFVEAFKSHYPGVTDVPGRQSFTVGNSEVWFLGPTSGRPHGEALTRQEDAFFTLGEAVQTIRSSVL